MKTSAARSSMLKAWRCPYVVDPCLAGSKLRSMWLAATLLAGRIRCPPFRHARSKWLSWNRALPTLSVHFCLGSRGFLLRHPTRLPLGRCSRSFMSQSADVAASPNDVVPELRVYAASGEVVARLVSSDLEASADLDDLLRRICAKAGGRFVHEMTALVLPGTSDVFGSYPVPEDIMSLHVSVVSLQAESTMDCCGRCSVCRFSRQLFDNCVWDSHWQLWEPTSPSCRSCGGRNRLSASTFDTSPSREA